jgi:hypothetical protein
MGNRASSALGAALGVVAGAVTVGGAMAAVGAVLAVLLCAGVAECATGGLIIGSIFGAVGGVLGGWARGASGRAVPAARVAIVAALAAVLVLFGIWGPFVEKLVILFLAFDSLVAGVVIGDRAAAWSRAPRVRFTVRQLMVAVAIVATVMGAGAYLARLQRLRVYYSYRAAELRFAEASYRRRSYRNQLEDPELADRLGRLAAQYERAAARPWLPAPPDRLEPVTRSRGR